MRDLQFWLDKYDKAYNTYWQQRCQLRLLDIEPRVKLKKIAGHGQNRDYDGFKVGERREKWLKNKLVLLTQAGKLRRSCNQLLRTKFPFYEKKVVELGGAIPSWMKENLEEPLELSKEEKMAEAEEKERQADLSWKVMCAKYG